MLCKTYFIDIDGTLFTHKGTLDKMGYVTPTVTNGVHKMLNQIKDNGGCIVITTARPESMRDITVKQLATYGIFYDQIIFGLPHGERVVINDNKPGYYTTAIGITIPRNKGVADIIVKPEYDIGICSGYFACLHEGHLDYFRETKKLCNQLFVIVNNDEQYKKKYKNNPPINEQGRLELIKNLKDVSHVILSIDDHASVANTLLSIRKQYPTERLVFANGGDQKETSADISETAACQLNKIYTVFLPGDKRNSSSKIMEQLSKTHPRNPKPPLPPRNIYPYS